MAIRQFECPLGHVHEIIDLAYVNRTTHECPDCGQVARRRVPKPQRPSGAGRGESRIRRAIARVKKADRSGLL